MKLYHGTKKQYLKKILRQGLQPQPIKNWLSSWWSDIVPTPAVFASNHPTSGPGSSPQEFARYSPDEDGYIVIIESTMENINRKTIGIWTTHDIDYYHDNDADLLLREIGLDDSYCAGEYPPEFYLEAIRTNFPKEAELFKLSNSTRFLEHNPQWMNSRKQNKTSLDCQILLTDIPPDWIVGSVKVWDGRAKRILPEFDPKRQCKEKHKNRSFKSLFLHTTKQIMD